MTAEERSIGEGVDDSPPPPSSPAGSPYATGGGGVTFERRVAARYLARMLTGQSTSEHGATATIASVALQQAPVSAVDDIVVHADVGGIPMLLAVAARARPRFITSHADTQKLYVDLVRSLLAPPPPPSEHRLAIAVAGALQGAAAEVQSLAVHARNQPTLEAFRELVQSDRVSRHVRRRIGHLNNLVQAALNDIGMPADSASAERRSFELLRTLWIVSLRVEPADDADWVDVAHDLRSVASDDSPTGGAALRDAIEARVSDYAPAAATVDLPRLRRDLSQLLSKRAGRAAEVLRQLRVDLRRDVHRTVADRAGSAVLELPRLEERERLRHAILAGGSVVVHGGSGVGKSNLAVTELEAQETEGLIDLVALSLRDLPATMTELRGLLGADLAPVLAEAPKRVLLIDGADAVAESRERRELYTDLLRAAEEAQSQVITVTSTDAIQTITSASDRISAPSTIVEVQGVTDAELDELVSTFTQLSVVGADPRSRELLRRPVVADLLVRSGPPQTPLTDADVIGVIWSALVRNNESRERGLPDDRERVVHELAEHHLTGATATPSFDGAAVEGLRHSGILKPAGGSSWQPVPQFAHEQIRTYAVARVLLANNDPAANVRRYGTPRWALAAARLACQALLNMAPTPASAAGTMRSLETGFAGLGTGADRWADVPAEALLTSRDPGPLLRELEEDLRADDARGLARLLRILSVRHRRNYIVDYATAEPLVPFIIDGVPQDLFEDSEAVLLDWLKGLTLADAPAGHPMRVRVRDRIHEMMKQEADVRERVRVENAARRAQRTPEDVEEERRRMRELAPILSFGGSRRKRREVLRTLTDKVTVTRLALLARDLGVDGERLLRDVAEHEPDALQPAVETVHAPRALASYSSDLLLDLAEAYYIELPDDDDDDGYNGGGYNDNGIRSHVFVAGVPMAAAYLGPFREIFHTNIRKGIAFTNRMLNHAAQHRARKAHWGGQTEPVRLHVTGAPVDYYGDDQVYPWYRGAGSGPYPCMSALQALEELCDPIVEQGYAKAIVPNLYTECENLAMPALAVGLLLRHFDRVGELLDPYLAEPVIWKYESMRLTLEYTRSARSSEQSNAGRDIMLRTVALLMARAADSARAEELRAVGRVLLERREAQLRAAGVAGDAFDIERAVTAGWTAALDQEAHFETTDERGILYVNAAVAEESPALAASNAAIARNHEELRLIHAYGIDRIGHNALDPEKLLTDIELAKDLRTNPPTSWGGESLNGPAAVAVSAIQSHVAGDVQLDTDTLRWAEDLLCALAEAAPEDDDNMRLSLEPEKSAAFALPYLVVVAAGPTGGGLDLGRQMSGLRKLALTGSDATQLALADGLNAVVDHDCLALPDGSCTHQLVMELARDTTRQCKPARWNSDRSAYDIEQLLDPLESTLAALQGEDIIVHKLSAAIRVTGHAATSSACIAPEARTLLDILLDAHVRAMTVHDHSPFSGPNDAAVAAGALLGLAVAGDHEPVLAHVSKYVDDPRALSHALLGLAAASRESTAADTLGRLWPALIHRVLDLVDSGHDPFSDHYFGTFALSALMPSVDAPALAWSDPVQWHDAIERWVRFAAGKGGAVDALLRVLHGTLDLDDQARLGLPWLEQLVSPNPAGVSAASWVINDWLRNVQSAGHAQGLDEQWQRIVDLLVAAGDVRFADLAD